MINYTLHYKFENQQSTLFKTFYSYNEVIDYILKNKNVGKLLLDKTITNIIIKKEEF